jgi:hypothetical protein
MHATAARRPALHARTHTRTHAHTAPRLLHASVHTTRAQRLPPGPPAHAMPRLSGGTRPARAQRPSPGARARAWHRRPSSSSVRYTGRVAPSSSSSSSPCVTRAALNRGQRHSHRTGQEAPRSNKRENQQSPCDTHERERVHGMHRQQAMPAALTHTPRTPPHTCNSCPPGPPSSSSVSYTGRVESRPAALAPHGARLTD